jgi:trehalose/maltose hydrolase-like predicted phosphorylase
MERILKPTADDTWLFGMDSSGGHVSGSRFAISNGFLGTFDAAVAPVGDPVAVPARTYVAGLFDTVAADDTMAVLVPAADWLRLHISISGTPLARQPFQRTVLDVSRGVLMTETRAGSLLERGLRLVSLHDPSVGLQLIELGIEEAGLQVTLEASVDVSALELVPHRIEHDLGVWRTRYSGLGLAMAVAAALEIDGSDLAAATPAPLTWSWSWTSRASQVVRFRRCAAIVRSDAAHFDLGVKARDTLNHIRRIGWRSVVEAHEAAWASRWHSSDVQIAGDAAAQRALRFAAYHLNSAANPADERVSIGARALTGEGYHGHVFWDTEIFLLPFYILTWPEAARSLLMYRFHTLDGARAKAARMGWRGALYAWESALTGAEMTPERLKDQNGNWVDVLCGTQEQHISADVAYAVWQYWRTTGDDRFLLEAGAEILLETARFWASRAVPEADGFCHIRGVIGPDENHEHIDDNAFTNVMARWNIRRALDAADMLKQRWPQHWSGLSARLGIDEAELLQWSGVAERIVTGFDPETGMYEQFAGFFDLEDIDLASFADRTVPVEVQLGQERTQNAQIAKQADVVALLALLPEEFPEDSGPRNFRYYEPRCSHRSSLSPAMHGLVASRYGDVGMAMRFFRQTAAIDLGDRPGPVDEGVHIAALGGIWMLAVFGFAGLSVRDDGIALDPRLPESWDSIAFRVQWRGRCLHIGVHRRSGLVEATLEEGEPMMVTIGGERREISRDQGLSVSIG